MRGTLTVLVLSALAAVPAGAQTATPMSALSYYEGAWACAGGPPDGPTVNATATFVLTGGVLTETQSVPPQAGMETAVRSA